MVYRFLLMAVVCVASHAAMARDGVMQPHKAVYELSLSQARQASAITNISGTLEY
ncbi:MAG: DUF1849 family protein, partial [Alphaproteobacteria bacterium]|nr:DUF1849 family protein [Alphaproteobacteria bacterium]